MSKSKWKELPQWDNEKEYAFLTAAKPPVWAWEFLRRHPRYRNDWQTIVRLKKKLGSKWSSHPDGKHYSPPRYVGEAESKWQNRAFNAGVDPIKLRKDLYLAQKWGVRELYDPYQPFSQGVRFIPPRGDFPRLIHTPDDFFRLVEEEEESGIQHVKNHLVLIAFDVSLPIRGKGGETEKLLRRWRNGLKDAGQFQKAEGHAGKSLKWKRHIQVLDACRTKPAVKSALISERLGGKKSSKSVITATKEGEKFIEAAEGAMENYRKILLFGGGKK